MFFVQFKLQPWVEHCCKLQGFEIASARQSLFVIKYEANKAMIYIMALTSRLSTRPFETFGSLFRDPFFQEPLNMVSAPMSLLHRHPVMDVVDADSEFVINAEVPGFKKEDIKIQVDGNTLILSGNMEQSTESSDNFVLTRERTSKNFQRSIVLPSPICEESIDAKLDSGVLTLHVPKNVRTGKMISIK